MSNARSPREVCSITIGINGLMRSPPHERGGVPGEPGGSRTKTAPQRRGLVGETWFPPRERTEGERRSCRLLASGGPELRIGGALLLLGRPQLVARPRQVERNPLHVGDDPVERLAHPQVLAQRLMTAGREDPVDDRVGVLLLALGVLVDEC